VAAEIQQALSKPGKLKIILAFLTIYIIWGSTYIAIKFALESFPPFLLGATRFATAGLLMCSWMFLRGAQLPRLSHIRPTAVLGFLLLVVGSMGVVLAEKTVPSGMVSLLVAMVPVDIVLLQWLTGGHKPGIKVIVGLAVGISGLVVLLEPAKIASGASLDLAGVSYVLLGCLGSAAGAIYSRKAHLPHSQQVAAGMEMFFAGLILFAMAAAAGEFSYFSHINISLKAGLSWLYLLVFGSMLAFSVYIWLLKQVNPAHVATYAYVNPVVAIFLGCTMAGEVVSSQTFIGAGIILVAVWLITRSKIKTDDLEPGALALAGDSTALEICALDEN